MSKNFQSVIFISGLVNFIMFCSASLEIKHSLRVASDLSPRFLTTLAENGRFEKYKGFTKDFVEELVNMLGYQYEIILAQDHRTSIPGRMNNSSGYWDGVIGMLIRNEADLAFAVSDTEVTTERAQVVDFSSPVLTTRFAVLHKRPTESKHCSVASSQWAIFTPFPISVWMVFIVLSILYYGFFCMHQFPLNSLKLKPLQRLKYSKKFAIFILSVWMMFLFTAYVSNYTAQKVLHATTDKCAKPQTLVDIISQHEVKIGWLARGPVEGFFRNTVNELYQRVYMMNVGRDWISSVKEGVNKVLNENGNFALILDSLTASYEALIDCSLYTLPQGFGPIRSFAVATPIGSPLRERINQAVLSLTEQGIIETLHRRWFYNVNSICSQNPTSLKNTSTNASIQEMSPIFIVAVIGLFFATVVGLVEMQLLKKTRNRAPQAKPPRQQSELLPKFSLEVV